MKDFVNHTAKKLFALFAIVLISFCSASVNALPLTWRADWPDAKPVETLVHRGTDIEFQPQWYINKEAANTNGWTFTTFCQTNAVGPWFGPLPGAFFSHTNDVGAAFYNVMVRAQTPGGAVNYTAFARLRMLDSPGFAPGELPLPVATIDFSRVVAINAPWALTNDVESIKVSLATSATNYTDVATRLSTRPLPATWILSPVSVDVGGEMVELDQPWWDDSGDAPYTGRGWQFYDPFSDYPVFCGDNQNATTITATLEDGTTVTATRTPPPGYILGTQSNKVVAAQTSLTALGNTLATNYYTISETDDAIDALAAYYITYTAAGAAFPTRAALTNATVVYSGGAARTPTRNDYAVVLADESHGGAEWRYIYTVAAGATSGQWDAQYPIETNDYDALSNKPQINGVSLSGNKTAAQLGVASTADATLTERGYSAWELISYPGGIDAISDFTVSPYEDGGEPNVYTLRIAGHYDDGDISVDFDTNSIEPTQGTDTRCSFDCFGPWGIDSFVVSRTALPGYVLGAQTNKPLASAGMAITNSADIAALASRLSQVSQSATNYTDASISPTSPAFSNAVLSVGLGIDTNTVAAINELVDSAHDLTVTGATSVGALLLALAAAVAALKKNLRYSYNDATVTLSTTTDTDDTATVTNVADRAINTATLGSSVTAATVTLPAATANRARDFFIDLTIEATDAPTLTFIDPATSTTINVAFGADSLADIDTGKNAVLFTEFPNYTWLVSVKHEEAAS